MRKRLATLGVLGALLLATPHPAASAPSEAPTATRTTKKTKPVAGPRVAKTGGDKRDAVLERRALRVLERSLSSEAGAAAAKALADLGHADAVERLKQAVVKNPRDAFSFAALVWIGAEPYVQEALAAVRDPKSSVGVVTMYGAAFTRRPHPDVTKRLVAIWKDKSEDPLERLWAAVALLESGDAAPKSYLRRILRDKDPYAAAVAATGLLRSGDAKARSKLTSILRDRKSDLWDLAAVGFGEHPDRDHLPLLRRALQRARSPYDRVWLAWAVLRTMDYRYAAE